MWTYQDHPVHVVQLDVWMLFFFIILSTREPWGEISTVHSFWTSELDRTCNVEGLVP